MRSRTCTNPPPAFGGKDCSALGPSTESGHCKADACPGKKIHCSWISNQSICMYFVPFSGLNGNAERDSL